MCSMSLLGVNPSSTLSEVGTGLCPMMETQFLDLGYSLFLMCINGGQVSCNIL